ncbi:MAG: YHS domain-containing protein [bacterium]|nr:YHS domain-containing protein [bacterium]
MKKNTRHILIGLLILALSAGGFFYIKSTCPDKSINCAKQKNNFEADKKVLTCPVMGTRMSMNQVYDKVAYKDKTYYFCCSGCKPAFLKEPGKYVDSAVN